MYPNWFETFFEGLAVEMWRGAIPVEQTTQEVEFLIDRLNLTQGMAVLDVPCGTGRHSVELAGRGMNVTGVDSSESFLDDARASGAFVEWVQCDMRNLPWAQRFDAAFCWGNSFGYFDHESCQRFLDSVARSLKPGGRFVLESGAVAESLLPSLQHERQLRIGDIDFLSTNTYNAAESRLDITYTFIRGDRRETKPSHLWIHSAAEIARMLKRAGMEPIQLLGGIDGSPYTLGSPRLIAIARRL